MKKYLAILLAMAMLLSMTACGTESYYDESDDETTEEPTTAVEETDGKLPAVELQYYYIDTINEFYNQWQSYYGESTNIYLQMIYGLDVSLPLNQQYTDETKTQTWAAYFVDAAMDQAKHDYALAAAAEKAGVSLSESGQAELDKEIVALGDYAAIYGFSDANAYLSAWYGTNATVASYKNYAYRGRLADEYYAAYGQSLIYTDQQRNAYQADKMAAFNSYAYSYCYLNHTDFCGEGTEDENGNITYTDEQQEKARKDMADYAKELVLKVVSGSSFQDAVETGGHAAYITAAKANYSEIDNEQLRDWLAADGRTAGDITAIPVQINTIDGNGTETTLTNDYYVVVFEGVDDNNYPLANLDLLYAPCGGEGGFSTDADRHAAFEIVETYLQHWESGDKTAASFREMAEGLPDNGIVYAEFYENVSADTNLVQEVLDWAMDPDRSANETAIVEAEDGFYLLLYIGQSSLSYRQYLIDTQMRTADWDAWYEALLENVDFATPDTSKLDLDMVISP